MTIGTVQTITTLTNTENTYNAAVQQEAQHVSLPEGTEEHTRSLRQLQDELVKDAPSISLITQLLKNMKSISPQLLKIAFTIFSNPLTALALSYDLFIKED